MSLTREEVQQLLKDSLKEALQPLNVANANLRTEIQNLREGLDPNSGVTATERQIKSRVAQEETQNAINRIKERLLEQNVSFQSDEFDNPSSGDQKKTMKMSDLDEFDGTDVYSFELSVDAAMAQFSSPVVAGMMARVLKGVAKTWFQNVDHRIRDGCLVDADEFIRALKNEFAIDKGLARQTARDRKWKVAEESVANYYYDKLKLVGNSYGSSMDAAEKCFEVRDGLPEDFKVLIRTTLASRPTLEALRKELTSLEADYLATRFSKRSTNSLVKTAPVLTMPMTKPVSTLAPQLIGNNSRIKQENFAGQRRMSIRDSFDPKNIGSAPNPSNPSELIRTYTVPDGTGRMLYLNRPCRQCGGQHFDFEPNHGRPVQSRMATGSSSSDTYSESDTRSSSFSDSRNTQDDTYGYPSNYIPHCQTHQQFSYGYPASYGSPYPLSPFSYPAQSFYPSQMDPRVRDWDANHLSEFYQQSSFSDPIIIEESDSYYTSTPAQRLLSNEEFSDNVSRTMSKN